MYFGAGAVAITIVIIGVILIIVVIAGGINLLINNPNKNPVDDYLGRIEDFSATQKVMGLGGSTGLAIDEQRKKVCLIDLSQQSASRVFSYKDMLSSEIFEDGTMITKTVRSSQIGGILVGALALGGVGAVIGGLSGKTQTSSGNVKNVDLRLTVNDTQNPLHDIKFLYGETKKDSFAYRHAMQLARHWHGLVEVLIRRADMEDKTNASNSVPQIKSYSVADEIRKLAELRDTGVLSSEEFQEQKARLLGS